VEKNTVLGLRLPHRLKQDIENLVEQGRFTNASDFTREAIRDKLRREKEEN